MTCIIGLIQNGKIFMGGDSAAIKGVMLRSFVDPKVFCKMDKSGKNKFLMGFAGMARAKQIVNYSMEIPDLEKGEDLTAYFVQKFVPALQHACNESLWLKKVSGQSEFAESIGLVGVHKKLFYISSDFTAHQTLENYFAIGSGENVAFGSLYSTKKCTDPEYRINLALEAADKFCTTVSKPFTIISS